MTGQNREIRILQLEDSPEDAETIRRQLRKSGVAFTAERVETAESFTRALDEFRPDIVIADYRLPGFDGRAALAIARARCPDLPVIVVSGALGDQEAVELIKAGAADFLLKDRLARLGSAVLRAMDEARAEKEHREHEETVRHSLEESVQAVARAVEVRDPYVAGHQSRVANLAGAIAREMGLDPDRVRGIEMGAGIHDLGKITVPTEILTKPGRLTKLEFELIKTHAQTGYEIVKDVHFAWPVAEMIWQHHERLDGSGYPRGLKGDQILLDARIISIADVVEAMAGPRPYRAALGIDAALAEIVKGRGVIYDAAAVDACLKLFREKGYRIAARDASAPLAWAKAA